VKLPSWAPREITAAYDRLSARKSAFEDEDRIEVHVSGDQFAPDDDDVNLLKRIITDPRMETVWAWFRRATGNRYHGDLRFVWETCRKGVAYLPKPDSLTKTERSIYLKRVSLAARELFELLDGTEMMPSKAVFERTTLDELGSPEKTPFVSYNFGDDDEDDDPIPGWLTLVATNREGWWVMKNGVQGFLGVMLTDVELWANNYDDSMTTYLPSPGSKNARSTYFVLRAQSVFDIYRCMPTVPILTTLANVALGLDVESEISEEAIAKILQRHPGRHRRQGGQIPSDDF